MNLYDGLDTHMRYRYTSFFWSRSAVAIFFRTSGNSADTSLPKVMDMMVFWMASFLSYVQFMVQTGKVKCANRSYAY